MPMIDLTLPEGKTNSEAIVWSRTGRGSYMPTPLIYNGILYVLANNGLLDAYNVRTGEEFYRQAIGKKPELARRVVFLTGDVVNEETQAFLRSTGNPHLAKPFQLARVEEAVAKALRQSAAGDA